MEKRCVVCDDSFFGQSNKIYCSNACKQMAYRLNATHSNPKQQQATCIQLAIQAHAAFAFKLLQIKKEKGVFYEDISLLVKQIEKVKNELIEHKKTEQIHRHGQALYELAKQIKKIAKKQKDDQGFLHINLGAKHLNQLKEIIEYSWIE